MAEQSDRQRPTEKDELLFFATPGSMTALPDDFLLLEGLPEDVEGLCQVSKKLIAHEFIASSYGIKGVEERAEELETRPVTEMITLIDRLDPDHRPLAKGRPPEHRMIGNCRHFVVLTCALLRRAGVPARARAGFADYFDETWVDHWVVERWDADRDRWVRTDPQLDEVFHEILGYDFDPLDLPEGRFLDGSEAWRRCRRGEDDPARFGLQDMNGLWFIASDVIRDLANLHKVELLTWDTWGMMDMTIGAVEDERTALMDAIAAAVVDGTAEERRGFYERDGLRVPETVRSQRFQRDIQVV
jgi:Transglutaminase-like superfamily